ncbi:MAG: hypothetical protein J5526_06665 [Bacteroidales bacterium]|nr:hypothetical protein [Bacteroidales bacterium]
MAAFPFNFIINPDLSSTSFRSRLTIVRQFGITATIAKCYLRQLTEYGYLESHGGNRNRTYRLKKYNFGIRIGGIRYNSYLCKVKTKR